MSIFLLGEEVIFPPVELADPDGVLAVGGDLTQERLILAYRSGIFPWYNEGEPIIWYSPDPRFILFPEDLVISKSMQKILDSGEFSISFDKDFTSVIHNCKSIKRKNQSGTWITDDMTSAYIDLHKAGIAHSVEVWKNKELVGGLYGLAIGSCFFGESMFSKTSNASKAALISLLKAVEFSIIDCQVYTEHLESLGAKMISRTDYLGLLRDGLKRDCVLKGPVIG